MSRFSAIDLSALTPPDIIETLDYEAIVPGSAHHAGQHYGIMLVEFGVGTCVFATMLTIFYHFAGREPEIGNEDW